MPDTGIAASTMPPQEVAPQSTTLRQVVTGNRLRDGVPVYFAGDGHWSTAVEDALHVAAEAGESLLAASLAGAAPHPVVAPYLIDAILADGRLAPSSLRERIRAFGPTVPYR
jgi:sulfite reductase (NADPH) hemoprotein beta-component